MYKKGSLTENNLILITGEPNNFPSDMLDAYAELLRKGGAVDVDKGRLAGAGYWAIILNPVDSRILAAGALKRTEVNQTYYRRIFGPNKASLTQEFSTRDYPFDLGYIVTDSNFRRCGYCDTIMDTLLKQNTVYGVLATTQSQSIKKKLQYRGFKSQGVEWRATDGGLLSLYLHPGPDHME